MKKLFTVIYRMLCDTSLIFCAIVMLFAIFLLNTTTANLNRETILSLFGFSALFGLSAVFGYIEAIPSVLSSILRFIVTSVGFVVFILISFDRTPVQMFVATAFFAVIYWVAFLVFKLIRIPFREKKEDEVTVLHEE